MFGFFLGLMLAISAHADPDPTDVLRGLGVSRRLLERFPTNEWIYVLLGSSPAIISAHLVELAADGRALRKIDLPLSGLKGWAFNYTTYDTLLHEHFDRFVTAEDLKDHRKILVVEYAATGRSYNRLMDLMARYARARNATDRFEGLVLRLDPAIRTLEAAPANLAEITTQSSGLLNHEMKLSEPEWLIFQGRRFEVHAPYGKFHFRNKDSDRARSVLKQTGEAPHIVRLSDLPEPHPAPNWRFDELRAAVRAAMDAELCPDALAAVGTL